MENLEKIGVRLSIVATLFLTIVFFAQRAGGQEPNKGKKKEREINKKVLEETDWIVESGLSEEFKKCREKARNGSPQAQYRLGLRYLHSHGIDTCYSNAASWFRKSALQNHALAQNKLGETVLLLLADDRIVRSSKSIASMKAEAFNSFQKSAEQEVPDAMLNLGYCFYYGVGTARKLSEAVANYTKAAEAGVAGAQYNLGLCYKNGTGISQDEVKALHWFLESAKQGNPQAQYFVAAAYENGLGGFERNAESSFNWYLLAAKQNHFKAIKKVWEFYYCGIGVKKDFREAKKWEHKIDVAEHFGLVSMEELEWIGSPKSDKEFDGRYGK